VIIIWKGWIKALKIGELLLIKIVISNTKILTSQLITHLYFGKAIPVRILKVLLEDTKQSKNG